MNMPSRLRPAQNPTETPAPEDHPATHEFFAHHTALKAEVRELKAKLDTASHELGTMRFERQFHVDDADKLRIQVRELQAANNTYKVSTGALAAIAMAEVERSRDACQSAVRDVTAAAKSLGELADAKVRDVFEAASSSIKRAYDCAKKTIDDADAHALRAGIDPDGTAEEPTAVDDASKAQAA